MLGSSAGGLNGWQQLSATAAMQGAAPYLQMTETPGVQGQPMEF